MRHTIFYSLFLIIVLLPNLFVEARTWTPKSGKNSFEAEVVDMIGPNVVLKKPNGQVVTLQSSDLSKKDQNYLSYLKTQNSMRQVQQSAAPKVTLPHGIRIEPIAVSVSKADPIKETPPAFAKGSQMAFLISSTDASLGVVDKLRTKLECRDDTGAIIGTEKNVVMTWKMDPRGRQILATFSTPTLPSVGSKKLILTGSVTTYVSEGKKEMLNQSVSLIEKSEFQIANQDVLVQKMPSDDFMKFATDSAKMKIALLSEKSLNHIDQIDFFDKNNDPLTSCTGESLQKEMDGKTYYMKEYYLAYDTDDFSMKIDFYEKSKVMVLPVSLAVDFGL